MFKLSQLLTEDTNLLEIFICPKQLYDNNFIDVLLDDNKINKIKDKFKVSRTVEYDVFYMNNLSYIYDKSNDNQMVSMRMPENNLFIKTKGCFNDFYAITYKEDKLPTHYFPCTNDIDYYSKIIINELRINNRITIIVKNENDINSVFIQYKHASNVDIDKIQDSINLICKSIASFT